jgi:hypothetical protein
VVDSISVGTIAIFDRELDRPQPQAGYPGESFKKSDLRTQEKPNALMDIVPVGAIFRGK